MRIVIASETMTISQDKPKAAPDSLSSMHVKDAQTAPGLVQSAFDYMAVESRDAATGDCMNVGDYSGQCFNLDYFGIRTPARIPSYKTSLTANYYVLSYKDVGIRLDVAGAFKDEEAKSLFFWG